MCLYPKVLLNRKYCSTKKNRGVIPEIKDQRTKYVPVGCGKCIECMKQKSRAWNVRLHEEIKENKTGKFVTLTFSNESIAELNKECGSTGYERDNEIATLATRRYLERWRKKYKKSLRHWLVTELGHNGTENIHLHGIVFSNEKKDIVDIWKYGYVYMGEYVNAKTVNYITKYITKIDKDHKYYKPKVLTSAGIGKGYINKLNIRNNQYNATGKTNESYKNKQGIKMNLPIYYRNKIYSEDERELLWIQKLDEETRYVCGEKIDISNGDENYYKCLKYYRVKNEQYGYGNDEKEWSKVRYENQKRNLKMKERISKIKKEV